MVSIAFEGKSYTWINCRCVTNSDVTLWWNLFDPYILNPRVMKSMIILIRFDGEVSEVFWNRLHSLSGPSRSQPRVRDQPGIPSRIQGWLDPVQRRSTGCQVWFLFHRTGSRKGGIQVGLYFWFHIKNSPLSGIPGNGHTLALAYLGGSGEVFGHAPFG